MTPTSAAPPAPYVLITPARNEEALIATTIESVIRQTVLPVKWVIVSDGSTDRTDEIVASYLDRHPFLELVRAGHGGRANFGSKVKAFWAGYERLAGLEYDFIGNLDADVSFDPDYFERLLREFAEDPDLCIAGGEVLELLDGQYVNRTANPRSVPGAVQMFRREFFEESGGFSPLEKGGEDALMEIKARMAGWSVRTITSLQVLHHRRVLAGGSNGLSAGWNRGMMAFDLGYHPLFYVGYCLRHMWYRPVILSSLCAYASYVWCSLSGRRRPAPEECVRFLRAEQLARMRLGRPPAPVSPRARRVGKSGPSSGKA